jgi:hypothetical protein
MAVMKEILEFYSCPNDWKGARTVLIYKWGDKSNPRNWHPITITSVLYRIVFCRFTEGLNIVHEDGGMNICDTEQKGFVPKKNRLCRTYSDSKCSD